MQLLFSGASRDIGQTAMQADGPAPVPSHPRVDKLVCLALALLATVTSIGIAVLSGWQRGSGLAEKIVCIALGVMAVFGLHLLPALARGKALALRGVARALCVASFAVVLYGQAEFFLFAQQHAGTRRAAAVPPAALLPGTAVTATRNLTAIAQDQETVRDDLAKINARRCDTGCAWLHMRHDVLAAKLDSLTTEAREARRQEDERDRLAMMADRADRLRDSLRDDPVTARLSVVMGVDQAKLDLLLALFCACVLDGLGSLCWYLIAARSRADAVADIESVAMTDDTSRLELAPVIEEPIRATDRHATDDADERLAQLVRAVAAGELRPTVDGIRQYFRCSQKDAIRLRRQYQALRVAIQADGSKN
ncbi:TPA: hypothetical protein QDA97_005203 [Burkholderia vietnamiensis]|nr:hypothetical protein [Burkholderia vietnamiensis]